MSSAVTTLQGPGAGSAPTGTTRAHWWILIIIAAAQLMVVLDTTIMIIALPSAQHALGFSNTDRQWVVTAYTLAFGGFLLLGGRLGDMFGPKRTLMAGVLGFALASALGGAAQTTLMLIGARGLQGLFGALLAPSVLSLLTSTFSEPRERGRAFGIYATIAIAGSAFGLILGGFLTQYVDWRWCLYVNLPIAALVLFGAFTLIPNREGTHGIRLDVLGVILGCGGLVALVYGLGEAGTSGWGATDVIVALVVAALLLAAFIVWQGKGPNPLLPLRVLRNRNRAGSFITILLAVTGMFGTFLFLTYLLQTIDHYSPLKTGVAFLPLMALNALAATQVASRLMPHVRTRLLVVPGLLLAGLGVSLFTQLTPDASYVTNVLPSELLLGFGLGLAIVPCISTATQNAEPNDVGVTAATTNTSQQIGASIGTALLNTLAAAATATYLASHHVQSKGVVAQATVHGYAVASAWAAGIFVLAAVLAWVLIDVHPGRPGAAEGEPAETDEGADLARHPRGVARVLSAGGRTAAGPTLADRPGAVECAPVRVRRQATSSGPDHSKPSPSTSSNSTSADARARSASSSSGVVAPARSGAGRWTSRATMTSAAMPNSAATAKVTSSPCTMEVGTPAPACNWAWPEAALRTVTSTARPSAAPTCCVTLTKPDAAPASAGSTSARPACVRGTSAVPEPTPRRTRLTKICPYDAPA